MAAVTPSAWAEKEITIRRLDQDAPHHGMPMRDDDDDRMEKEKVTFLGVETAPVSRTLTAQLGLGRDTGLVVTRLAEKSPAADLLKEDDVLIKLDDQILVNQQQLGVLVRAKKEGDEVRLTVIRGGKETTVKAKLGSHEVPKMAGNFFFQNGPGGFGGTMPLPPEGLARLRELPGMDDDHARDVLSMIGREHRNFMTGPGVRIFRRGGQGSTILDLPNSNISYSDDDGSVEIKANDGKRELTVKDAKGKVTFQGPVNTEEDRKKLPPEVLQQLEKLDPDSINFEPGEKFRRDVLPLPGEPAKTKIRQELGRPVDPQQRPL
ncbi:PDZ domain-containing protein [Opitutus sp. GAS368]|uniref:PDZ domain-containing protein n=1 Tax=Opitutus sp. GAS368 TaxID=1882749 RepID=UPI0012FD9F32|nr:PDZ domain-containing protein [Opitutus sp. GAS368]